MSQSDSSPALAVGVLQRRGSGDVCPPVVAGAALPFMEDEGEGASGPSVRLMRNLGDGSHHSFSQ